MRFSINNARRITRMVLEAVGSATSSSTSKSSSSSSSTRRTHAERADGGAPARRGAPSRSSAPSETAAQQRVSYAEDFRGVPDFEYAPNPDGLPDPGEIVWTWVPYEEDHSQGKDRPVLLVGRDGRWLLGMPLTSKDHDRDAAQEAHAGRTWVDIGSGPWDTRGRPSEVRTNRVIRVDPDAVRREGAVLDRARFDQVAAAARAARGR